MEDRARAELERIGEAFLSSIEEVSEQPRKRRKDNSLSIKSEEASLPVQDQIPKNRTTKKRHLKDSSKKQKRREKESKMDKKQLHEFRKEVERFGVRGFSKDQAKCYLEDKWVSLGGKKTPGKHIPKNIAIQLSNTENQQKL